MQLRPAEVSLLAGIQIFQDFVAEGILDGVSKVGYLENLQKRIRKRKIFKVREGIEARELFSGQTASSGAIFGQVTFSADTFEELVRRGIPAILAINYDHKIDFFKVLKHGDKPVGFIADYGNDLSHETQLAYKNLIPGIVNGEEIRIGDNRIQGDGFEIVEGDMILLDGSNMKVYTTDDSIPLEEDDSFQKMVFDIDIMEARISFLNETKFLRPTIIVKNIIEFAELLEMKWYQWELLLNKEEIAKALSAQEGKTFEDLFELNYNAWQDFLDAEAAERKDPENLILQKETLLKTIHKMFYHELLKLNAFARGMSQEEFDHIYDEYMNGYRLNAYQSKVVFERIVKV